MRALRISAAAMQKGSWQENPDHLANVVRRALQQLSCSCALT
eukprot:CAMPEP_0172770006 /NCGR_PEP_ID=MMETSP1074-20121228/187701_1 /TAXON_ID=2916 /ORGANISM="Ceratium fusus, Strain PA161109" /LENGTH=41 /DNA_ID= /DNA_START= /DNA_END= /DNA_ORIENTATION=